MMLSFATISFLGAAYWFVAARLYTPTGIGLASAAISAMMFLGNLGMLGFNTLLVGEIPRNPERAPSFISTSLIISGVTALLIGIVFALNIGYISPDLAFLGNDLSTILLFSIGVMLTGIFGILDQAYIGLLRGEMQLIRNIIFSIAKLVLLPMAIYFTLTSEGLIIYATWTAGNLISFLPILIAHPGGKSLSDYRPNFSYLSKFWSKALSHHVLNLALLAAFWLMPLIVTTIFSPEVNAGFYIAWLMANFLYIVPVALNFALLAVSSSDTSLLTKRIRFTLSASFLIVLIGVIVTLLIGSFILSLFGPEYVETASSTLYILAFGAFPLIIRAHYIAINQIHRTLREPIILMMIGAVIEISFAILGGVYFGLIGLSIAWVIAFCIEALITLPKVYQIASGKRC